MHVSEGVLSAPVLAGGAVVAAAGVAVGLRRMDPSRIPAVALLSSTFFVASLIHVPLGPASAHLVLNGLAGLVLGWMAFPALLVGLALQAVLFQYGGLTTLGINTVTMAAPAVAVHYVFRLFAAAGRPWLRLAGAALSGALAILASGVLLAAALRLAGEHFREAAHLVLVAHAPVMVVEAVLTGFCVVFIDKVKPQLLDTGRALAPVEDPATETEQPT